MSLTVPCVDKYIIWRNEVQGWGCEVNITRAKQSPRRRSVASGTTTEEGSRPRFSSNLVEGGHSHGSYTNCRTDSEAVLVV
jgi:hypothetical protein